MKTERVKKKNKNIRKKKKGIIPVKAGLIKYIINSIKPKRIREIRRFDTEIG